MGPGCDDLGKWVKEAYVIPCELVLTKLKLRHY